MPRPGRRSDRLRQRSPRRTDPRLIPPPLPERPNRGPARRNPRGPPPADPTAPATDAPDAPIPGSYHPRYRRDRIEALLRATRGHTLETLRDVQADLCCAPAHALAGRLARLAPPPAVPEELRREL